MPASSPEVPARDASATPAPYYAVSLPKLALLSLGSFGLYNFWWFYQQWRAVQASRDEAIRPGWRAVWAVVYCYPLFQCIQHDVWGAGGRMRPGAPLLTISFVGLLMLHILPGGYGLSAVLAVVPLLVVQQSINELCMTVAPAVQPDRHFDMRASVLVLVGTVGWMVVAANIVMPETYVVDGGELSTPDLEYLHEAGYLHPGEDVIYFYSGGRWSIEEDGNLLTSEGIVSYENVGGMRYHKSARFEDIYDVSVTYAEHWYDTTWVTIITRDGDAIVLMLAPRHGRDRAFVERLRNEWRQRVPEGEEELYIPFKEPRITVRA